MYDLPKDLHELFEKEECQWSAVDYAPEMEMDNVEALTWFMEIVGISEDDCVEIEDTQIIVQHPDFSFELCIDSGGLGDFFSHAFEVSKI